MKAAFFRKRGPEWSLNPGVLPEATHLLIAERRQTQAETGKLHRLFPICLPHHGGTV